MSTNNPPGLKALSEAELDRLAEFLDSLKNPDAMDLETLDGFFCALIAGPEIVMPSEYLPAIWGGELPDENAFASIEEANAILQLIMRHWNAIIAELEAEIVYVPVIGEPDERNVAGRSWARGFMRGVNLRRYGWNEIFAREDEGQVLTIPIVAGEVDPDWPAESLSDEKRDEMVMWMAAGMARSHKFFAAHRRAAAGSENHEQTYRRSAPKVGRNDRCPCGSGKKFKHCCGTSQSL
jgi:uncharacterized protein